MGAITIEIAVERGNYFPDNNDKFSIKSALRVSLLGYLLLFLMRFIGILFEITISVQAVIKAVYSTALINGLIGYISSNNMYGLFFIVMPLILVGIFIGVESNSTLVAITATILLWLIIISAYLVIGVLVFGENIFWLLDRLISTIFLDYVSTIIITLIFSLVGSLIR